MTERDREGEVAATDARAAEAERAWAAVLDRRLGRGGEGGPLAEILAEALVASVSAYCGGGDVRRALTDEKISAVPCLRPWARVIEAHWLDDDPIDPEATDELEEAVASWVRNDDDLERFVDQLGGGTMIGQVGESRSWSPAHSTSPLWVHSFRWRDAVWSYVTGDAELIDSLSYERGDPVSAYHAEFLSPADDDEARRSGLIGLTGRWFGAGLEWDPDPDIRSSAREDSLYCFESDFRDGCPPWEPPVGQWRIDLPDGPWSDYASSMTQTLQRPSDEIRATLEALQQDPTADPAIADSELLAAVKQELWWACTEHDRGW